MGNCCKWFSSLTNYCFGDDGQSEPRPFCESSFNNNNDEHTSSVNTKYSHINAQGKNKFNFSGNK